MRNVAAVYGKKCYLAVFVMAESHIAFKIVFQAALFVIISARTLPIKLLAGFKTINVKTADISSEGI